MAKTRRLNDASSKVISEEILKENPKGLPHESGIVIAKEIPEFRRVIFVNQRDPGYPLEFHYASATHPLKQYKLLDGHEYNLQVEVVTHLESCAERMYGYRKGADGHPEMFVKGLKYIFSFRNPPSVKAA